MATKHFGIFFSSIFSVCGGTAVPVVDNALPDLATGSSTGSRRVATNEILLLLLTRKLRRY